jgi:hypothetical protein
VTSDDLRQQAEQFRASGLLGKPGTLTRLFDFLLERSISGEAPKETEIAIQVFGKSPGFDVSQDAVVRVYVHKLRRRLEDFGARARVPGTSRIVIPKGEYRLVLEAPATTAAATTDAVRGNPRTPPTWLAPIVAAVVALIIGALIGARYLGDSAGRDLQEARRSAVWAPLLADDMPITIVVGDYYLLGEVDPANGHVRRLVREFFINSHEDFRDHQELNPELMQRYRNLDLTYLPVASAFALQDIVPVLGAGKPVRVLLMSELNPGVLKTSHVVYIGYISGLGMLGDRVFSASRFVPGGSYDEVVDLSTKRTYLSTAMGAMPRGEFKDYGYFSTFAGPSGNRIVIVAGTRDTGVMQVADALRQGDSIRDLCDRAGSTTALEALYEVSGVAQTSLHAQLLFATPLKADRIWDAS